MKRSVKTHYCFRCMQMKPDSYEIYDVLPEIICGDCKKQFIYKGHFYKNRINEGSEIEKNLRRRNEKRYRKTM